MAGFPKIHLPIVGMGATSLILGAVGLFIFIFPILSIPLGGIGLLFGLIGMAMAIFNRGAGARWSLAGIALSGLTLAIGVSIAQTAAGYLSTPPHSAVEEPVPDRPFVPPPARPGKYTTDS